MRLLEPSAARECAAVVAMTLELTRSPAGGGFNVGRFWRRLGHDSGTYQVSPAGGGFNVGRFWRLVQR